MSQLIIFVNVPRNKWNWFFPISHTTTGQCEGKILDQGAVVHRSCSATKIFFFHTPGKLPSASMFLHEMMMSAQNLLSKWFGNIHEMNAISICTTCTGVIEWFLCSMGKSMKFLQVHRVLWLKEKTPNTNCYTALKKKNGSIKKKPEVASCCSKLEDILNHPQSFIKSILWKQSNSNPEILDIFFKDDCY